MDLILNFALDMASVVVSLVVSPFGLFLIGMIFILSFVKDA